MTGLPSVAAGKEKHKRELFKDYHVLFEDETPEISRHFFRTFFRPITIKYRDIKETRGQYIHSFDRFVKKPATVHAISLIYQELESSG